MLDLLVWALGSVGSRMKRVLESLAKRMRRRSGGSPEDGEGG